METLENVDAGNGINIWEQAANMNRKLCKPFQTLTKATEGCRRFTCFFFKINFLLLLGQIQKQF